MEMTARILERCHPAWTIAQSQADPATLISRRQPLIIVIVSIISIIVRPLSSTKASSRHHSNLQEPARQTEAVNRATGTRAAG